MDAAKAEERSTYAPPLTASGASHASAEGHALPLARIADLYIDDLATRARPRGVIESRALLDRTIRELGARTVGDLDRSRVSAWRQQRISAGASNKTVNNALAVLLAALAYAATLGVMTAAPLHGLRQLPVGPRHQRRRPRALSEWEIAQLLAACESLDREGDDYLAARRTITGGSKGAEYAAKFRVQRIPQSIVVRALIETGARWGELVAATWADLDEPGALLTLRAETTKTDTERAIPLGDAMLEDLRAYRSSCAGALGRYPGTHERIFLSPQGKSQPHGTANFRRFLGAAYERAGLLVRDERRRLRSQDGRALNVHTLRHTCCTRLARAGVPLPAAQAMLGHASPAMTLRVYSHFRAEAVRPFIACLTQLPRGGTVCLAVPGVSPRAPGVGTDRSLQGEPRAALESGPNQRLSGS